MTPNISRVAFKSLSKFIYRDNLLPPRQNHRPAGQRACFHGFLPLPFSNFIVTRQFLPFTWIWQKTIPALSRRQLHIPATVSSKQNKTDTQKGLTNKLAIFV
jgi:hypothetical protein